MRISTRNARFQQLEALLSNRTKRTRAREFLVQGVRPITLAVDHGWTVRSFLYDANRTRLSRWADELLHNESATVVRADRIAMAPELLAELSEKNSDGNTGSAGSAVEVIAVVEMPPDELTRIPVPSSTQPGFLGVVFDRPTQPGNIGSILRSADAFGAHGLVVTGHAADPYDPKSVRASTGSIFAVPVVRAGSHQQVLTWLRSQHPGSDAGSDAGNRVAVVGTDEAGDTDLADFDLTQPVLLVIGNETTGLSTAWRESCDHLVRIPMTGAASSLNASNAAAITLYETHRQRLGHGRPEPLLGEGFE